MKKLGYVFLTILFFLSSVTNLHAEGEVSYQHIYTKQSKDGSVTLKVEWNDPVLGEATTFHVSAEGGTGEYKFLMQSPSYSSSGEYGTFENVADPSRGQWVNYTDTCLSNDYSFTMTASGTYYYNFHVMYKTVSDGPYYTIRSEMFVNVSDANHPSVNEIVNTVVSQCNRETNGSEYEKALWLHDWLIDHMEYDNSLNWSSSESAFTRGIGTCQSYTNAYGLLLNAAGIANSENRDTTDAHTWNTVSLDGAWYQIDATWDDSVNNYGDFDSRHVYFGLSDELMAIAHPGHTAIYSSGSYGTRATSLNDNYFVKNGKAQEWANAYADEMNQHLLKKEVSFSISATNANQPPSISGIQNGIIAYMINQMNWDTDENYVTLSCKGQATQFIVTATYKVKCKNHTWNEGEVTTQPTCTETGIKTYTCTTCGATKTEEVEPLGHHYSSEWTVDQEATCTEKGRKSHHCTRCNSTSDTTTISALGHISSNNWTVDKQATCTENGSKSQKCTRCGEKINITKIATLGHSYSSTWTVDKNATCTEEGSKSHHCTRCNSKKDVTGIQKIAHEWNQGTVIRKSTYTTEGIRQYTCVKCGTTRNESISKLTNHTESISYQTHVQDYGWQSWKKNGDLSGTAGQSKRLEGIKININNLSVNGNVLYRTHVQNIGWQDWRSNGSMSGTSGLSLRLEAIQIKLTDELAEAYDIYYRVHAQDYGWLDWAKNGESAGTEGRSKRLEAIQIVLVEKGKAAPGSTNRAFVYDQVSYQTHVQDYGWQSYVSDGNTSGTFGQSKRLEGIKIKLSSSLNGGIQYRTHVQDYGWQSWSSNDQMSGTSGQAKRLEAIQIKLTGEIANQYDVYYRVHCQDYGWLGWAKNGESSGSEGYGKRLEGIQIVLVKKGSSAPGNTNNHFYKR